MTPQSSFFGNKREPVPQRLGAVVPLGEAPPLMAASATGPGPLAAAPPPPAPASLGASLHGTTTGREPGVSRMPPSGPAAAGDNPSKLTVGPNIKLKGVEITDCDTLVVEGLVEATMDSRVIQIEKKGEFDGSARVDLAIIKGVFKGTLDARKQLVIHATGRVSGVVRYGSLVVEEGGQLTGEVHFGPAGTL